jgi:hypothetical protein
VAKSVVMNLRDVFEIKWDCRRFLYLPHDVLTMKYSNQLKFTLNLKLKLRKDKNKTRKIYCEVNGTKIISRWQHFRGKAKTMIKIPRGVNSFDFLIRMEIFLWERGKLIAYYR